MTIHSPGRINLIGEHIDYTGGLVLPASIDKGIQFEVAEEAGAVLYLHARDLEERHELALPVNGRTGVLWVDYLAGIVDQFQRLGHQVPGLRIDFGGNIPRGSGMSSSAALEGGMAFLLNEKIGAGLSRPELALLCQRSSNEFLGIPTGIMDQFASLNGVAEGPILLNCDTLEFDPVDANLPGYTWMLANSMVTHELSGGGYHVRVKECAAALDIIQQTYPEVKRLCKTTFLQLDSVIGQMAPNVAKRARYALQENERVAQMAHVLRQGNVADAGRLLNEGHRGMSEEYEASCEEVDFLQRTAVSHFTDQVAGARIMGGGFGGCTINLLREEAVEEVQDHLTKMYEKAYGITPEFYPVRIGAGTHLMKED